MYGPARWTAKHLAAVTDKVWPSPPGAVVLIYHRVGGGGASQIDLPVSDFDAQMERVADDALTLDDALDRLTGPEDEVQADVDAQGEQRDAGRSNPIVVTFDDGTADIVDHALPILVRWKVPAVIYVATDHIERGVPFPADGRPASWQALRDAMDTGFVTIGSHTHSHALLDRISPEAAATELDRSIELIEDRLGTPVRHFAYPKALLASPPVEAEVERRFVSAAIGGNRPNPVGATNPLRLNRTAVQTSDGPRFFERKIAGGMHLEESLRRIQNRRKYRGIST